jgi:hypothetical protein
LRHCARLRYSSGVAAGPDGHLPQRLNRRIKVAVIAAGNFGTRPDLVFIH